MLLLLLASAGCHGNRVDVSAGAAPATIAVASSTTLDKVWLIEASGLPVPDTSVTFAARSGRTIVLRHARPDNAIFLILDFPPSTDSTRVGDSLHVRVQPVAGKYAFTLSTSDTFAPAAQATFSYAIHFRPPAEASAKYPSTAILEQALGPALLGAANKVQFVGGTRPAADVVRFPVAAAGSYGLVVVR
ncbi:MAG TPA: hypothetical protein VID74_05050 [Gemmatimonadales bacterium]|jgi:hypothetical protein